VEWPQLDEESPENIDGFPMMSGASDLSVGRVVGNRESATARNTRSSASPIAKPSIKIVIDCLRNDGNISLFSWQ
jgi:hypothetical protein